MMQFLMTLLAVLLVATPYALVTLGVYLLVGMGWALIVLGVLILLTVLVGVIVAVKA